MKKQTTLKQLLTLSSKKISFQDAELLLAHALKKTREFIIANPKNKPTFLQKIKFKYYTKKRSKGIPIAYITGNKEFFGLNFKVNKHTLIPRPDTEILVEKAIKEIKSHLAKNKLQIANYKLPILIDIGTGSGCIPISILNTCKLEHLQTYATDVSGSALKIAKKNSKKYNADIQFVKGNLIEPITKKQSPIFITANLPYLTNEQYTNSPSIQKEPKTALVAKNQGLALYEELLWQIKIIKTQNIVCLFEIDPNQTKPITNIIKTIFPKAGIEILKDLSGLDRVVHITI